MVENLLSLAIWTPIVAGLLVLATGGDKNAGLARIVALVGAFSAVIRRLQTGFIYSYATAMIIGLLALMTIWFAGLIAR